MKCQSLLYVTEELEHASAAGIFTPSPMTIVAPKRFMMASRLCSGFVLLYAFSARSKLLEPFI